MYQKEWGESLQANVVTLIGEKRGTDCINNAAICVKKVSACHVSRKTHRKPWLVASGVRVGGQPSFYFILFSTLNFFFTI